MMSGDCEKSWRCSRFEEGERAYSGYGDGGVARGLRCDYDRDGNLIVIERESRERG